MTLLNSDKPRRHPNQALRGGWIRLTVTFPPLHPMPPDGRRVPTVSMQPGPGSLLMFLIAASIRRIRTFSFQPVQLRLLTAFVLTTAYREQHLHSLTVRAALVCPIP